MSQQEKRALRQKQEPRKYLMIKLFASLILFGSIIAAFNPSGMSNLQAVSMENLMSTAVETVDAFSSTTAIVQPSMDNDKMGPVATESIGEKNTNTLPTANGDETTTQCAICFFGLPRSYKELVLPSIVKNVLETNFQYKCDIFVHYYARKKELKGRLNPGGNMDPNEIFALKPAVEELYAAHNQPSPAVVFVNDTERTFFDSRQTQIDRYLKKRDGKSGKKLYFPWKQKTWKRSSLVNLIRQWHSIEKVFETMHEYMTENNKQYTRVAMLRNDAMYLSPIDIWKLDNDDNDSKAGNSTLVDTANQHFVMPPFAQYPVNDRMIYGPFDAIKIWSTRRFDLVEDRAKDHKAKGNVMHSESFMYYSIIPAMEALGFKRHKHPGLCFVRTRPDSKVLFNDCRSKGTAKGFETTSATLAAMAPGILGSSTTCEPISGQKGNKANHLAQCTKKS